MALAALSMLDADGVRLACRRRPPDPGATPRGLAVLCHPHPAFGGNMDVWLLPAIGRVLAADGWTVVRFDTRGAGRSSGRSGDGTAEVADLAAVLRWAGPGAAGARTALVGWSFGALVALLHGLDDPSVTDWVGIGPPTQPAQGVPLAPLPPPERIAAWSARRTVVVGQHDQFFPPATADVLVPHAVHVVAGADHFLFDRDHEVASLVAGSLACAPPTASP